ncbi:MAG: hypothetical protein WCZ23_01625 [Rhodospirillaceae bacterium]
MLKALTVFAAVVIVVGCVGVGLVLGVVLTPPRSSEVHLDMPAVRDAGRPVPVWDIVSVDSIRPDDARPLDQWRLDTAEGGVMSHVSIAGPQPLALGSRSLDDGDVLLAVGWAGEPLLGVPFRYVVFSVCGSVVGAVQAGEPRPDVTRHVHPNLTAPGWTARLAVAHLPRCDRPVLKAWAAHSGGILYPLEGEQTLALRPPPDAEEYGPPLPPPSVAGRPPLSVDTLPPFDRRTIEVAAPRGALLRRCASADCEPVGGVAFGQHAAMILDDSNDDWVLLVADGQAGWLSRSLFTEPVR